jgi:hypothetical protein
MQHSAADAAENESDRGGDSNGDKRLGTDRTGNLPGARAHRLARSLYRCTGPGRDIIKYRADPVAHQSLDLSPQPADLRHGIFGSAGRVAGV